MSDKIKDLEAQLKAMAERGEDTAERVDLLNKLAAEVGADFPLRGLQIAQEANTLATRLSYKRGIARSLSNIGFSYYLLSDHDKALGKLLEAVSLFKETGDEKPRARSLSVLASVYHSLGDFEPALSTSFESLRLSRALGDHTSEAWLLNGIGGAYYDLGDHARALQYHEDSLKLFAELGHAVGRARALNGIGTVYQGMRDYEKALEYHRQSLDIFVEEKNKLGEARALNDIGTAFQALGKFDDALDRFERSLELREEVGNKQAMSTSLINIGNLYIKKGEPDKAMPVLHRALTIAMEIKAKPRVHQANLALSEAYSLKSEFSNALDHYKIYQQVKEEVAGDQANSRIKNLQIGFEVEKAEKEAEISRLRNVELKRKNEQLKKLLKELKETQTQLVQSEKMAALGSLIAGVVHEINNPIGAINSASDVTTRCIRTIAEVLQSSTSIEEVRKSDRLAKALKTLQEDNDVTLSASRRIAGICNSLKSFIHLDEAEYKDVDVNEDLENTLRLLSHGMKERIRVVKAFGKVPRITGNAGELNQAFMNIINNAMQAIRGKGTITIETFAKNKSVHVRISDTGIGIEKDYLDKLFEPTIQKKGARVKAGLGLFTSYNIVKKHDGDIRVKSKVGEGTTFTLILPAGTRRRADRRSVQ